MTDFSRIFIIRKRRIIELITFNLVGEFLRVIADYSNERLTIRQIEIDLQEVFGSNAQRSKGRPKPGREPILDPRDAEVQPIDCF